MINAEMRQYNYFLLGELDAYGQRQLPAADAEPEGQVKMAIGITSQNVQDNINYLNANYIGITHANVDDTYIIEYGKERLKVLYVNTYGRYKQVFMVAV